MRLAETGHVVIPNFLDPQEQAHLDAFFIDYEGAGVLVEFGPTDLPPWLLPIERRIAEELRVAAGRRCPPLEKIWFQRSTSSWASEHRNEVPFLPHIDKRRYLKAMLYVSDVDASSGAMHTSGLPPENYERMRRRLTRDY